MMQLNKTLLLACLVLAPTLGLAAEDFSMAPVADNIYVVQVPGGNTLVAVDTDGLILVDGVPAEHARAYLDFVQEATGVDRVKTLVLSHWHPAVTGLNGILGPMGVEIIAHDNTRQWLASTIRERGETIVHTPDPADSLPNRTFYWGKIEIPFRDDVIEIGYLLQAHTDGDIYARFVGADVLYAGSALHSDQWTVVDETTNGFIGGLTDAFDTLGTLIDDATVIVPGSGPLMDKADFAEQETLYKGLKEEMVKLLRASRGPEEVLAANPAQGLKPEWGDPTAFLDQGFRSFYGHLRNGRQIGGGFP